MAYSVSSATGLDDVISQMCAFAVTNAGFADQGTTTETTTSRTLRRISKGGIYWTFRRGDVGAYAANAIEARMSYSIVANVAPTLSNGQQQWTRTSVWSFAGPYTNLYLYTDSTNVAVHAVIECASGIYAHMSFGNIIKTDTFTGGEYISGCYSEYKPGTIFIDVSQPQSSMLFHGTLTSGGAGNYWTYMRQVPASGSTGDYFDFAACASVSGSGSTLRYCNFGGVNGWSGLLMRDSPNTGTLRSPMFPFYVSKYDIPSTRMAIAGYVPGARLISNENVDSAEILLSNWQVFPMTQKNSDNVTVPSSLAYGIAYYRA